MTKGIEYNSSVVRVKGKRTIKEFGGDERLTKYSVNGRLNGTEHRLTRWYPEL